MASSDLTYNCILPPRDLCIYLPDTIRPHRVPQGTPTSHPPAAVEKPPKASTPPYGGNHPTDACYPLALIRTSINILKYHYLLSSKLYLLLNNLLDQNGYEPKIKGHHAGASELLFKSLQETGLMVKLLSKPTWIHTYFFLTSNTTYLVTYKVVNNNFQGHQSLTTSVTIYPYNISSPFSISIFSGQ